MARALSRAGLVAINDVILSDRHGLTQIDHLVCGPYSIVVLETKTYTGEVSGTPDGEEWSQVVAGLHYPHRNGIHQNDRHCAAVAEILEGSGVTVEGYVVSAGRAVFCNQLASHVVPVDLIGQTIHLSRPRDPPAGALDAAWQTLSAAAEAGEDRRDEHQTSLRRSFSRPPPR